MLTEINPLIVTPDGEVKALDSKFTVDDAALFRHPDIAEMRDLDAVPPEERAAREKGVTYVKLDGEVGILGNGAGLGHVDARRDRARRRAPRTSATSAAAATPRELSTRSGDHCGSAGEVDPLQRLRGITRCDEVARGILAALDRMPIEHPDRRAARRDGTPEEGREILKAASPANLHVEPTMLDAARRAVELAA